MNIEKLNDLVDSYLLTPNSRHPGDNLYLKKNKTKGAETWSITNTANNVSLNSKILQFCYEPINSEKDDSFYSEHRFESREAALQVLKDYLAGPPLGETQGERDFHQKQKAAYKTALADIF